jgi:hypothetical protein
MTMPENVDAEPRLGDVDQLADQLLDRADADQAQLLGPEGLLTQLTQRVLNRALDVELAEHLGYEKGDPAGRGSGNNRNGATTETVLTDIGAVPVVVPRDAGGEFEPKMVPKHARRLAGFNEQILSLYARGMSVRDIRSHLANLYGVQVSPDLISKVTDAVTEEITTWGEPAAGPGVASRLHRRVVGEDSRAARSPTARSTSRSGSTWTAANTSSGCGSVPARAKAPVSGCRCSRS